MENGGMERRREGEWRNGGKERRGVFSGMTFIRALSERYMENTCIGDSMRGTGFRVEGIV